jgi:hypothetical protein
MRKPKIRDRKLLQLIDKENKSQSEAAKELGLGIVRYIRAGYSKKTAARTGSENHYKLLLKNG